ncbi:LLM class flavin-dependent oxidoreductase [Streptomyces sp. NPDC086549]|uniref:LLM class flavin-dependent oxidoreductase n=1 Tax=Streptomyces sp. NPDC086549 TaxID=3365752 RepID=UPI0037FB725A
MTRPRADPILLAHQLATLDRLSGGRLIAGMGGGFPNPNTQARFTPTPWTARTT